MADGEMFEVQIAPVLQSELVEKTIFVSVVI